MIHAVKGLHRARSELARTLQGTPASVLEHVGPALTSVRDLEAQAVILLDRGEALGGYLRTQNVDELADEVARVVREMQSVTDLAARAEYERTVTARREQLATLGDIRSARDRVVANLSRIVATLDGLPSRLVRLRALDAQALDALGDEVGGELDAMVHEIRVFEDTLRELADSPAAAPTPASPRSGAPSPQPHPGHRS